MDDRELDQRLTIITQKIEEIINWIDTIQQPETTTEKEEKYEIQRPTNESE